MKRVLASFWAALCALAPLAGPAADATAVSSFSATLEPRAMHEECAHLAAGEKRNYSWRADAPVDFNVHYHHGDEALYPVKRDAMRGDGGTFVAKAEEDYCWMWTARERPAKIEGRIAK